MQPTSCKDGDLRLLVVHSTHYFDSPAPLRFCCMLRPVTAGEGSVNGVANEHSPLAPSTALLVLYRQFERRARGLGRVVGRVVGRVLHRVVGVGKNHAGGGPQPPLEILVLDVVENSVSLRLAVGASGTPALVAMENTLLAADPVERLQKSVI